MAYIDTWNAAFEASPADGDDISEGAERIRDTRVAIRERMAKDHYMAIAGTDADHGEHSKITFNAQYAAGSPGADKAFLYTTDVSAKAELHFKDEDDNVVVLTSAGKIGSSGTDGVLNSLAIDTITEETGAAGVTIDGLLIKDGVIAQANSVDSDQYVDGSIDLAHMSANSVDSDQYVDGSIDAAHLADNVLTAAKMSHGLSHLMSESKQQGNEIIVSSVAAYADKLTFPVLMPSGPTVLRLYAWLYVSGATVPVSYARLSIGGQYSAGGSHGTSTPTLTDCGTVNVSGLTPGTVYELSIQTKLTIGGGSGQTANMKGFSIWWE